MLHILRQIETISACRDRDLLAATIVAAIKESFAAIRSAALLRQVSNESFALVARADINGLQVVAGDSSEDVLLVELPLVLSNALTEGQSACTENDGVWRCSLPIDTTAASAHGLLLIELDHPLQGSEQEALERFTRFYANYIRLLDYSEKDTLTQLFNRKTFDDSFDRLLAAADLSLPLPDTNAERRAGRVVQQARHWIAVADIDLFKRVNDTYGHLFGDEVLIRFAALMRKTFRTSDRLFRFGGEEFVIMLRPTSEANARRAFDRFREKVESYEFPQVGKVTCSLGYTLVDPSLAPTDILGQADQALYYGKNNGRNQINGYQSLIAQGVIAPTTITDVAQSDDIDALFG